ncbi:uncharacterized protein METZ01_LOCUS439057, partial [marine metagenome]
VFAQASRQFPREPTDHVPPEREATAEMLLERMHANRVDGAVLVQLGGTSIETHA